MFATVAVGLWLTPFTLRYLDREEYAIFALMSDVLMWLGLLDLGIAAGLRVQVAQETARPDQVKLNRLASTALFTQAIAVTVVLVMGIGLSLAFPEFFPLRSDLHQVATNLMILMTVGLSMSIGTQTFSALLIANQKIHIDNAIGLLNLGIRTVLTIILLTRGYGLYSLAVANIASRCITSTLAVLRTFRLLPGLKLRLQYASWDTLRSIGHLSVWFSLGGVAGLIINGLDRIVTAKIISVEMVTTLTLTGRLYSFSGGLITVITETARPMLGQLLGEKKLEDVLRIYRQLFSLSVGGAIVLGLAVWAANQGFVEAWVGPLNYGGASIDFALAINFILGFWVALHRAILSSGLIARSQVLCRIVEGALNLGLSIFLAQFWGVFGILMGTAFAGLATSCWYFPRLTSGLLQYPLKLLVWGDVRRAFTLVLCLFPVALLARGLATYAGGYSGAIMSAIGTGLAGLVLLWLQVFDAPLREEARQHIVKFTRTLLKF